MISGHHEVSSSPLPTAPTAVIFCPCTGIKKVWAKKKTLQLQTKNKLAFICILKTLCYSDCSMMFLSLTIILALLWLPCLRPLNILHEKVWIFFLMTLIYKIEMSVIAVHQCCLVLKNTEVCKDILVVPVHSKHLMMLC